MILFQDIVEILHRSVLAVLGESAFGFEPHDRRRVSGVPVGVNDARLGMVRTSQSFGQEALCCGRVLLGREEKVDRRTGRVHSTIQVAPLALDPNVGLVHPPTVVGRSEPRSQSAFHFRGVTLHPPPDGDVVGVHAPLGQQLLHVAVRQGETQVPAHCQEDHLRFELPPLEENGN